MQNKKILVFCEDPKTMARLRESLTPVHDKASYCTQAAEVFFRAQNEDFDVVIMRTLKPSLKDPKGFFQWCQTQKKYRRTPFVVVGEDVEDKNVLISHELVRFLPTDWKTAQLFDLLDGLFFDEADAAKKIVNVKFINPIVGAVVDVLGTMAQIQMERGTPALRDKNSPKTHGDVTGMISVNSENFSGSLAIVFKEPLILAIYQNMMSEKKTQIDDDVKDCVMELTNIVFGNARRDLNLIGHNIKSARPSVISGKNHDVVHSGQGLCLQLPFKSQHGDMVVELLVSMAAGPKKA
jgi:chemotaxis protein CheX